MLKYWNKRKLCDIVAMQLNFYESFKKKYLKHLQSIIQDDDKKKL